MMGRFRVKKPLVWCVFVGLFMASVQTIASSGTFTTLSYNIAGLPDIVSSAETDRKSATAKISCYVSEFDFVNVQEDFNYHATLYGACKDHPYRSPTTGGALLGSGLNTLSRFPYTDWQRVKWDRCSGIDCLTPKGFTRARVRLQRGVYVDIYNVHAQAETGSADLAARRDNISQLVRHIELNSSNHAVIILGDTNARYTRPGENIRELTDIGFRDVWVDLERGGELPEIGSGTLWCKPQVTSANCELVDKIFYRSGSLVQLEPSLYQVRQDDVNSAGLRLSDHPPLETRWRYSAVTSRTLSDTFGGTSGTYFNDYESLSDTSVVKSITIRSGKRIDKLEMLLDNDVVLAHGGQGGSAKHLTLQRDEFLKQLYVCSGKHKGHTRIFYAQFTTNLGRTLEGGKKTSQCKTFRTPEGWQIAGFHGRAGAELDKIGVVFTPL